MKNYKAFRRPIFRKLAKTDDFFTIFFKNINAALEKVPTLNNTCTTWNMIINSIDLFQGFPQGF